MPAPLEGLRVVSLCVGAVMPELTKLMAEYGADVIKIESEITPDFMRRVAGDLENSAGWSEANRNKRSFAVNLKSDEGRDLVRRLAADADVMGENYRGDVVDAWGLGYEDIRAVNPSIIYVSSQGFGRGGPNEKYPTFGPNLAPSFGLTYLWAHPDDPMPIGGTLNHPDHLAGKIGLIAVMAALEHRRQTGEGQFIDLAQAEAGAHMMGEHFLEYTYNAREPAARGNRSPVAAPQGSYPCAGEDRWCVLSVQSDAEWDRFCGAIDQPALATDPRFASLALRIANHDALDTIIKAWTATREPREVAQALQSAGVAAGWVQNAIDHLEDSHLQARHAYVEIDHPVAGRRTFPNNTIARLSETPVLPTRRAPLLGEHTDEICREMLGLDADTIADLRARKIIGY
ncbi:MAG TPA: CoA transferase [Tepidiformaceae bacterium]|nr:CoA transferase [Tepidiformaceae bacterium]